MRLLIIFCWVFIEKKQQIIKLVISHIKSISYIKTNSDLRETLYSL
jgi:hypothetical protein